VHEGDDRMRIAVAGDDSYARHIGALLCSIFENQSGKYRIDVFVLSKDISSEHSAHLLTICRRYGSQLTILPVDQDTFRNAPAQAYYTDVNYYRLLLPELLDARIDRILYLDSDIIVLAPLDDVWQTDVTSFAAAAVPDGRRLRDDEMPGTADRTVPVNSGLLLLNLDHWRRQRVFDQILAFIRQPDNETMLRYVDQDALNAVLAGRCRSLPLRFNVQPFVFDPARRTVFSADERALALKDPAVIHFCGPRKPWHYRCVHPYRSLYWKYARMTPWRGTGYVDLSLPEWALRLSTMAPPVIYDLLRVIYRRATRLAR
jgi:lipopolysaccharide biosynthesis glycosyltransferase